MIIYDKKATDQIKCLADLSAILDKNKIPQKKEDLAKQLSATP